MARCAENHCEAFGCPHEVASEQHTDSPKGTNQVKIAPASSVRVFRVNSEVFPSKQLLPGETGAVEDLDNCRERCQRLLRGHAPARGKKTKHERQKSAPSEKTLFPIGMIVRHDGPQLELISERGASGETVRFGSRGMREEGERKRLDGKAGKSEGLRYFDQDLIAADEADGHGRGPKRRQSPTNERSLRS